MNPQFYGFLTDTTGKFAALSLAARLPADFPGSGTFGDNVMRRVTFHVEKDADGKDNLVMDQSPLLAVLDENNTPYSITLARDVNVFMLEFWSVQDGDWDCLLGPDQPISTHHPRDFGLRAFRPEPGCAL